MRLFLMRHAATAGNAERRYVGRRTDEPLDEAGRAQCLRAGACDGVRRVYVSPLRRAFQTAQACFPRAELVCVPGLEEYDFGSFEGKTADEMVSDTAYRAWVAGGCTGHCPGGESRAEYVARSNAALTGVLREACDRGERSVVVVAHGGTIMAAFSAFARAAEGSDDYFAWHVGTCEGYLATVSLQDGQLRFGDCEHVTSLADLADWSPTIAGERGVSGRRQ